MIQHVEQSESLETGIYYGMSDERYFAERAWSKSSISAMRVSAHEAKRRFDGYSFQTGAMIHGTALEELLQRPDSFGDKFKLYDGHKTRCKAMEKAQSSEPKTLLLQDEWDTAHAMRDAIAEHETAKKLLMGRGFDQVVTVWTDPDTGLRCKAKSDRFCAFMGWSCHVDLKKIRADMMPDVDPWTKEIRFAGKLMRYMRDYGYDIQQAHYMDGCAQIDTHGGILVLPDGAVEQLEPHPAPRQRRFVFVLVADSIDPVLGRHRVMCFEYSPMKQSENLIERNRLLAEVKSCIDLDRWPRPDYTGIWPLGQDAIN